MIKRIGEHAGFAFPVHAHMLRHACGYVLANVGYDTEANRIAVQRRTRHTQLSAAPVKDFDNEAKDIKTWAWKPGIGSGAILYARQRP
jgi:type 1 fimbriae regulatory protein FimB/type 1 fimbriae regulatory protein FimE